MCLGIPGQIIEILPGDSDLATVDVNGVKRNISMTLLANEEVRPGDWVLIHVGFAMAKMDEEEAQASLAFLKELGQAYIDEMSALQKSSID